MGSCDSPHFYLLDYQRLQSLFIPALQMYLSLSMSYCFWKDLKFFLLQFSFIDFLLISLFIFMALISYSIKL